MTLNELNKILIELGKTNVELQKMQIDEETKNWIQSIKKEQFLTDYQKTYLIQEIIVRKQMAINKENDKKAILYILDFLNKFK